MFLLGVCGVMASQSRLQRPNILMMVVDGLSLCINAFHFVVASFLSAYSTNLLDVAVETCCRSPAPIRKGVWRRRSHHAQLRSVQVRRAGFQPQLRPGELAPYIAAVPTIYVCITHYYLRMHYTFGRLCQSLQSPSDQLTMNLGVLIISCPDCRLWS